MGLTTGRGIFRFGATGAVLIISPLLTAKDAPVFAPADRLTPAPLVVFDAKGMLDGGKPDTQIAVSKTHVVLVTTSGVGIYTRDGKKVEVTGDREFFCTKYKTPMPDGTLMSDFLASHKNEKPAWGFGDCKALYDPYRDRFWFLATFNNAYPGDGQMFWAIGVSNSGDPTQGWRTFVLPAHRRDDQRYTNSDFPMIGMDQEAFYVSVHVLIGNPEEQSKNYWYVLALDANEIASGKDLNQTRFAELTDWPDPETRKPLTRGLLMPAINTGLQKTTSGMKFVSAFSTTAAIWSLRDPFGKHPEIRVWTVPMNSIGPGTAGVKAHQKGTTEIVPIAFGGAIISVTQSGDDVYFVAQDVTHYPDDKTPYVAVRYLQVNTSLGLDGSEGGPPIIVNGKRKQSTGGKKSDKAPVIVKDVKYGANSPEDKDAKLHYVIPSAMINANGDAIVVENGVGESVCQDARASLISHERTSADYGAFFRSGEGANVGGWGDIAKATLDPLDHVGIWVATQYGSGKHAHIAVAKFLSPATTAITNVWHGPWANSIQAATSWPNGKAYFFRGTQYGRYDIGKNTLDPGWPADIAKGWHGVWPNGFDAVTTWPNGKAYFFRGSEYSRYNITEDKADPGYPMPIASAWPGIWPAGIDAVVVWPNGKAYFFRGSEYIRYDIKADKADAGYPRPIASDWPGLWPGGVDSGIVLPDGTVNFFRRGDVFRGNTASLPVVAE